MSKQATDNKEKNEVRNSALAGACAGFVSSIVTCPLDVIKTRLQVKSFVYGHDIAEFKGISGVTRVISRIWHEDGLRGFYRGLGPTVVGYLPTWAIYFCVYDAGKKFFSSEWPQAQNHPFAVHIASAMVAGATSTTTTSPMWVIKTRSMLQSSSVPEHLRYKNLFDAFAKIYQREGVMAFYKGLLPSLLGVFHVVVQFPLYEHFKSRTAEAKRGEPLTSGSILLCSGGSKMLASIATYPHEVLRTRLQMLPVSTTKNGITQPHYAGLLQTIYSIAKSEGLPGFYRGMGVNLVRTVPSSGLTILTYVQPTDMQLRNDHALLGHPCRDVVARVCTLFLSTLPSPARLPRDLAASMSTYADYFNEQYRGHVSSGPVRMIISRSDAPTTGLADASESCTVEELMDQEELAASTAPSEHHPTSSSTGFLSWMDSSSFAWMLDTSLEYVQAFSQALFRAQLQPHATTPRVYLLVPHVVLDELDQLKQSSRSHGSTTIGALARHASHWILDMVQQQKYSRTFEQRLLEPRRWILHVQALSARGAQHHQLVCRTTLIQTNDQTIVALCAEIHQNCGACIMLASDDTNACTQAELENIPTFSLQRVVSAIQQRSPLSMEQIIYQLYQLCLPQGRFFLSQPAALVDIPAEEWQALGLYTPS